MFTVEFLPKTLFRLKPGKEKELHTKIYMSTSRKYLATYFSKRNSFHTKVVQSKTTRDL
jgi:hypothetical protein